MSQEQLRVSVAAQVQRPISTTIPDETSPRSVAGLLRDVLDLCKIEIVFLVVLSAITGYVVGSGSDIVPTTLLALIAGVAFSAAGAGALNHYLERDLDSLMRRTARRPLPSGRFSTASALWLGIVLVCAGIGILCPLTTPMVAVLGAASVALYLFVYTPLKRLTRLNTIVGAIPGALPILGGYLAAAGSADVTGWLLFGLLLCWQIPHFLSLAWMYRSDYVRGGFRMTTGVDEVGVHTTAQMLAFSAGMVGLSLALSVSAGLGIVYLILATLLGIWFIHSVATFGRARTNPSARRVLKTSIAYIPMILLAIVLDQIVFTS
jgi:protoheme IX farnesyltransferase